MKKLIAFAIAAIMVLSMIPAMVFTASAALSWDTYDYDYPEASSDFWTTWRAPDDYAPDIGNAYRPAAGFEYTSEGFVVTGPDFKGHTTRVEVQSSKPVDLKLGFYVKIRIDGFPYKGYDYDITQPSDPVTNPECDEWISFSISDSPMMKRGDFDWNNNWCSLIRGNGQGQDATALSCITKKTKNKITGSFTPQGSGTVIKPELDSEGREIYEFAVTYDESTKAYDLKINGVTVEGMSAVSTHISKFEESYIGIALHSTQVDAAAGAVGFTILEQGYTAADADTPKGTDSREPEENLKQIAEIADPTTVPANQPALLFDANKTTISKDPNVSGMAFTPTGSMGYHCTATMGDPYVIWDVKGELSYEAQDFPVFVMMLKDFWGEAGGIFYGAGSVMGATNSFVANWKVFDDNGVNQFYGADGEYVYVIVDMSQLAGWAGRINCIRPNFTVDPNSTLQAEWDIEFMAFFRSTEEAVAYADAWAEGKDLEAPAPVETDPADESGAAAESGDDIVATESGETTANGETSATIETNANGETTANGETSATTEGETKSEEKKSGCGAVVGMGAVAILAAAAAAVVLKKKD